MIQELITSYRNGLDFFFEKLDLTQAEFIVDRLANVRGTIIFTGVGKSGYIAEKIATTFVSTGTKAIFLPPINALHGDIGVLSKEDLLVCLSKSGESEELLALIPFAKRRGVEIMSWVCKKQSRLEERSNYTMILPLEREICPFDLAPTTSTALQLIFGDIIAVALMKKHAFSLDQYFLNHPAGAIGKKISLRVEDIMVKGDMLPICSPKDSLQEVLVELSKKRSGCLLLVDTNLTLQGIFTDGDLRRAIQEKKEKALGLEIEEFATKECITVTKEMLASEAAKLMQTEKRIMVAPVIEEGRVVGLIRLHDIIAAGV